MERALHAGPVRFGREFFLDFEAHRDSMFRPVELRSLPFPHSVIPELLISVRFFVERVLQQYYLRYTPNGYFCQKLEIVSYAYEASILKDGNLCRDESGDLVHEQREVSCLIARFGDIERTVAYWFDDRRESAIAFFEFDGDPNRLPPKVLWLHTAAQIATERMLVAEETGTQKYLQGLWCHPSEA